MSRSQEQLDVNAARITDDRRRHAEQRSQEEFDVRAARLAENAARQSISRCQEQSDVHAARLTDDRRRHAEQVRMSQVARGHLPFALTYSPANFVCTSSIGGLTNVCQHCTAKKFTAETPGLCCSAGKAVLQQLPQPPTYLMYLLTNNSTDAKHFRKNIRKYNGAFMMTST